MTYLAKLQLLPDLGLELVDLVLALGLLFLNVAVLVHVTVRAQLLQVSELVQLIVIQEKDLLGGQAVVLLGHGRVLEACLHLATSDDVLCVEVIVLLKQAVEILLAFTLFLSVVFLFLWLFNKSRKAFELFTRMIMIG